MSQIIYNSIACLKEAVEGCEKPLLVCGHSFDKLCIKEEVKRIIPNHVLFHDYSPNPTYEQVCKGVDTFNLEECDSIVAIGGGSAIDVAKSIKLFCKMEKDRPYVEQNYQETGIKLIAIPTTAGTGSESTRFSLLYYNGEKISVNHDSIIPNVAILEGAVLKPLPDFQKKCTLLDALCQAIEAWWSVNSTDESKEYSREATEMIVANWEDYLFNYNDKVADAIMLASNLAGKAINIAQTTAPHAFSYKITSLYGTPHGLAVALSFPEIWQYMTDNIDKCCDSRGKEYLAETFMEIAHTMGVNTVDEAVKAFRDILSKMQLAKPHSKKREADIELLATSVSPFRLKNNPVELSLEAMRNIYDAIIA